MITSVRCTTWPSHLTKQGGISIEAIGKKEAEKKESRFSLGGKHWNLYLAFSPLHLTRLKLKHLSSRVDLAPLAASTKPTHFTWLGINWTRLRVYLCVSVPVNNGSCSSSVFARLIVYLCGHISRWYIATSCANIHKIGPIASVDLATQLQHANIK